MCVCVCVEEGSWFKVVQERGRCHVGLEDATEKRVKEDELRKQRKAAEISDEASNQWGEALPYLSSATLARELLGAGRTSPDTDVSLLALIIKASSLMHTFQSGFGRGASSQGVDPFKVKVCVLKLMHFRYRAMSWRCSSMCIPYRRAYLSI